MQVSDTINPAGTSRVTVDDGERESAADDPGRVSLHPLDPTTALKGLLAVDPEKSEDDAK